MQVIKVQIKQVYGKDTIYPVCDKAKLFAQLKGQTTLTEKDLKIIHALGYTVEVVSEGAAALNRIFGGV